MAQRQVYAYERLKAEMERLNRNLEAQFFFAKELRAQRELETRYSPRRALNFAYQILSGYGQSVRLPVFWLVMVFLFGTSFFALAPVYKNVPLAYDEAAGLSFTNLISFLPYRPNKELLDCLSPFAKIIGDLQSFLGVILLFLLGLALSQSVSDEVNRPRAFPPRRIQILPAPISSAQSVAKPSTLGGTNDRAVHRATRESMNNRDQAAPWPIFRSLQGAGGFHYDIVAGLTLAAIAIPEQMATARLGGFPPHIGFFAFIAGSIAFAVFGSNRFLSAGADSTITPIFAGALATLAAAGSPAYGQLAGLLALLVGVMLMLAGVFRAGWVADLLSIPVMTGFLAGISIHIAISQAPALLGLPPGEGEVFHRLAMLAADIGETHVPTLAIGASCLASIVLFEKISSRIPGALIALASATWVVARFDLEEKGVAVVGAFTVAPPHPAIPWASPDQLSHVLGLAVIVSVIIMVQTAATSRSFPGAPGETPDIAATSSGLAPAARSPACSELFRSTPARRAPPSSPTPADAARSPGSSPAASWWRSPSMAPSCWRKCPTRRWRGCCCSSPDGFSA